MRHTKPLRRNCVVIGLGSAIDPTTLEAPGTTGQVLTAVTGGPPAFAATAAVSLTTGVTGVLPLANGGTNQTIGVVVPILLQATAVAPGTVFLGLGNEDATEANVQWPSAFTGTLIRAYVVTTGAPGGTETFTYRPRIGGAVVGNTLTLTGAATTGNITFSQSTAIALGDLLSYRLVVSAAAGTFSHQLMLMVRIDG